MKLRMPRGRTGYAGGSYLAEEADGRSFSTLDPSRNTVVAELQTSTPAQIDNVIAAARAAQPAWAEKRVEERAQVLRRAAAILRSECEPIAALEVADTGRPVSEIAAIDIETAAQAFEFFAAAILSLEGRQRDYPDGVGIFRHEPHGVCAGIGAWNYPLQIASWKAAPALAAGNTMVFKPSEQTPLSALLLAETLTEAGIPDGVFNVVLGDGEAGGHLAQHSGIDHISMTGSVGTGRKIVSAASATVKNATLELGGKSPMIVLEDVDIAQAAVIAAQGNFLSNGEICGNTTRVFVPEALVMPFLDALLPIIDGIRIGDPMNPSTHMGALISLAHREKVHAYVEGARAGGATLACGGTFASVDGFPDGAFYQPTVLTDCRDDMVAVQEEIFGPVMCVLAYDNLDNAVARANDTNFGLCGAVVGRDGALAHRVARRLDAGTVWVNTVLDLPVGFGYGGFKQSGIGYENGLRTLEDHLRVKGIYTALSPVPNPFA